MFFFTSDHRHRHEEHAQGKLEQFGSVFWYLGLIGPSSGYKIQKNSKKTFFIKKKTVFLMFFVHLHRVPSATGTRNILCCRRGAPQAHWRAALQARSAAARRSQQEAARGTSEARVTSAHPQGRVTDVLMRAAGRQRARCEQSEAAGDR